MSDEFGATQGQVEADFINIMGFSDRVHGEDNTKLVDDSTSLLFANSPIFSQQTGMQSYPELGLTTTTTTTPGDINADIYVSLDQQMPQGLHSPDYTNLVPVQSPASEVPSVESLSYTDLSPAQTYNLDLQPQPLQVGSDSLNLQQIKTQILSATYTIEETTEVVQVLSNIYGIQHEDNILTVGPSGSPGYATQDHQVPMSEVLCTEWSPESIPPCLSATPEATTPSSTSVFSDDMSERALTLSPGPISSPGSLGTLTPSPGPISSPGLGAMTLSPGSSPGLGSLTPSPELISSPGPRSRRQNKAGGPVRGSGRSRRGSDSSARSSSRKRKPREKKAKLYELDAPFEDPQQEKKRLDAINSKKNRDRKRGLMDDLKHQVNEAVRQRDKLQKELDDLKAREANLLSQFSSLQTLIRTVPAT